MKTILAALLGLLIWVAFSSAQSLTLINRSLSGAFTLVFTTNDVDTVSLQHLHPNKSVQTTAVSIPGWAGNIRALPYIKADATAGDVNACGAPMAEFCFSDTGTWYDASIVDYPNTTQNDGFHWIYPGGDPNWNEGCSNWPCDKTYKYWNDDSYTHFSSSSAPENGTTVTSLDMVVEFYLAGEFEHPYNWTHDDSGPSGSIKFTSGVPIPSTTPSTPYTSSGSPGTTSYSTANNASSSRSGSWSQSSMTSGWQGSSSLGWSGITTYKHHYTGGSATSSDTTSSMIPSSSTSYTSPGSQSTSPGSQYTSPGSQYTSPGSQYTSPSTEYPSPGTTTTRMTVTSTLISTIYLPSDETTVEQMTTPPGGYDGGIVTNTIVTWIIETDWVTTTVYPGGYRKRHIHGPGIHHTWAS